MAEQERIEQLTMERKRAKIREHQLEVEKLWNIKLEQYRIAKEEEQR